MKKINGFTVTNMSMSGFKCFEGTVEFDFGDLTYITASNGQGKSSIADAIAFAFVGTPFFGDKGLDRLQNKNAQEMTVSVNFIDDTGETHNLTRTRKRDTTTIAFDGINARQSDLNTAFGDREIFLSMLNPLYFINVLGDNGKGLLEKLLPIVKHNDVLAALPPSSQEILANQKILMPETFIKSHRSELRKLEDTLIGYRSQRELLDEQREERVININNLQASIDTMKYEMAELESIRDNSRNRAGDELSLAEIRNRRIEMYSELANKDDDKVLQGIMNEIKAAEKSIAKQSASQYLSPYTAQIAEFEAKLKILYEEHTRLNKVLTETVVGYNCPTCAVIITDDNIINVRTDLQRRLSVLINEGKAAKNTLADVKVHDDTAKFEFENKMASILASERNKLEGLTQQFQDMNIARELDMEDYNEQLAVIDRQIIDREYRAANGNLTPEQVLQLAELEKEINECEAKIEALNGISDYDYKALITETEAEIIQRKRLIHEAIQYMAKRVELMLDGLKMNKTEIVLTEIVKTTGEIRDCFRFSYDGRDYRCLSLSEKVRAGLEIGLLLQQLTGRKYPIFVDNGESICSFGNMNFPGQMIISRVVRNQGLQVTYRSRDEMKLVA
jgi:hypothetical protein